MNKYLLNEEELSRVAGATSGMAGYYGLLIVNGDRVNMRWYGPFEDESTAFEQTESHFTGHGLCEIQVYLDDDKGKRVYINGVTRTYM